MESRALFLVVSLLAVSLAGCTEATDTADGAIKILGMPADPASEPLRLESTISADEYQWRMGDGRPTLTGKTVEHVYGVTDGSFRVELTTVKGGTPTTHAVLTVEFGTGQNAAPSLVLGLQHNWVAVGEDVIFTAADSTDAEGDPILLQWFCQRVSAIAVSTEGGHPPPPGIQFGSGSAAGFPVQMINGTLPTADRTVSGDLCENIGSGGFADELTIQGSFAQSGIYEITMAAKDPANPNLATAATIYVTDFDRIDAPIRHDFGDTIQYGVPAAAHDAALAAEQTDHMRTHAFTILFPIVAVSATLSHDGGASPEAASVEFKLLKGESSKYGPTADALVKESAFLTPGAYTAQVFLRTGAEVTYGLVIEYTYEMDPAKLFEAPHA